MTIEEIKLLEKLANKIDDRLSSKALYDGYATSNQDLSNRLAIKGELESILTDIEIILKEYYKSLAG